jgi:hypothetical protein
MTSNGLQAVVKKHGWYRALAQIYSFYDKEIRKKINNKDTAH